MIGSVGMVDVLLLGSRKEGRKERGESERGRRGGREAEEFERQTTAHTVSLPPSLPCFLLTSCTYCPENQGDPYHAGDEYGSPCPNQTPSF